MDGLRQAFMDELVASPSQGAQCSSETSEQPALSTIGRVGGMDHECAQWFRELLRRCAAPWMALPKPYRDVFTGVLRSSS